MGETSIGPSGSGDLQVTFSRGNGSGGFIEGSKVNSSVPVLGWPQQCSSIGSQEEKERSFIATKDHKQLLSDMMLSHHAGDFCLVGAKVRHMIICQKFLFFG